MASKKFDIASLNDGHFRPTNFLVSYLHRPDRVMDGEHEPESGAACVKEVLDCASNLTATSCHKVLSHTTSFLSPLPPQRLLAMPFLDQLLNNAEAFIRRLGSADKDERPAHGRSCRAPRIGEKEASNNVLVSLDRCRPPPSPLHVVPTAGTLTDEGTACTFEDSPNVRGDGVADSEHRFPHTHQAPWRTRKFRNALRPSIHSFPPQFNTAPTPQRIAQPRQGDRLVPCVNQRLPHAAPSASPTSGRSISPALSMLDRDKALPPLPEVPGHTPAATQSSTRDTPAMSYFSNAHSFKIEHQSISHVQTTTPKTLFEYLNPYIAHGAAYNSDERCDAPKCDPATRVAVQEEIMGWMGHGDMSPEPQSIMWLSGPAGSGKTAIAGSIAETCKDEGLLAASFFFSSFSGSADRRSKRCLITTIASHLAENEALRGFRAHLLIAIESNPSIFHKRLKEQAECLLLRPLRAIRDHCDTTTWPKGIVIDGLDEVEAQQYHDTFRHSPNREQGSDQLEILAVLFALATDPTFPFRIFIASRPECIIQEFFSTTPQGSTVQLFLDSKYNPDADITQFLEVKFAGIRRRTGISDPSWPGQSTLDRLVEMSSGQFIVPTTIIRWIEAGVPQEQLDVVMRLEVLNAGTRNPFATLDAIYRHILKRAHNPDDDPHLVVKWVFCITSAISTSRAPPPAQFWRQFLEDVEGELNHRMGPIASLVSLPPMGDASSLITIYHKSLTDFLSSPTRCGDLFVDERTSNTFIADRIVRVLASKGPAVPISFPVTKLGGYQGDFLRALLLLELLNGASQRPDGRSGKRFARFLDFLSEGSKNVLASCDVGWWAYLLLKGRVVSEGGFPQLADANGIGKPALLAGIYCGIHKAMKCDSNTPSVVTQLATGRATGTKCHAACLHWRKGILAEAKALNFCVHKMERIEVGQLGRVVNNGDFFKSMGRLPWDNMRSGCAICRPVLNESRDLSENQGHPIGALGRSESAEGP